MHPATTRRIAPAVVLAVALTGCVDDDDGVDEAAIEGADETVVVEGGDEVEVEDTDGLAIVEGDEEAREAVLEAVAATADLDARTEFSTTVAHPSVTNGVIAEGVSNGDDLTATMVVRGEIADALGATDTPVEVRVVDGTVYTHVPLLLAQLDAEAEWITSSVDGLDGDVGALYRRARLTQPGNALELLEGVSAAAVVDDDGEFIDGAATTHYVATVELGAAVEAAGTDAEAFAETGADLERAIEVHVYVSEDGLVRRMEAQLANDGSDFELVVDFLDHEVDVAVEAPSVDDTISLEQVLQLRDERDG